MNKLEKVIFNTLVDFTAEHIEELAVIIAKNIETEANEKELKETLEEVIKEAFGEDVEVSIKKVDR